MAAIKAKYFVRGIASYPKLHKAHKWDDAKNRSVPDPNGEYETGIVLSEEDASKLQANVKQWAKDNNHKPKKWPWRPEIDKATEEETGRVIFTAKQYAKDQDGEERKIPHVDAGGKPLPANFRLTGGSTIVAKVRPSFYKAQGGGIKLYLDAVQVVAYVEYENDHGFSAQEGYRASGEDTADDEDEGDDSSDNNESEDKSENSDTDF